MCRSLLIVLAFAALVGCNAPQPFPVAARAGDTVTLAVGSQDGMAQENTTITFTPDSTGIPLPLAVKSIFNLYPDKRSESYVDTYSVVNNAMHEAWVTVVAIDLPTDLPVGFGTIKINTTIAQAALPNAKVENVDYRLEILSGTGTPHNLRYQLSSGYQWGGNLTKLAPIPSQVHVVPPYQTCSRPASYAAIEMFFRLPFVIEPYRDVEWFYLVADSFSAYTGNKSPEISWSAKGDQLRVTFISTDGVLKCFEPRFSLVPIGYQFSDYGAPELLSANYYDTSGFTVQGPPVADYQIFIR